MRSKSPANKADSSPPVPARISRNVFLLSSGSRGNSRICRSCSSSSSFFLPESISSRANSATSGSLAISSAVAMSSSVCSYSFVLRTTGSISARSRESSVKRFMSSAASGAASMASSSSRRRHRPRSLARMFSFILVGQSSLNRWLKKGVSVNVQKRTRKLYASA